MKFDGQCLKQGKVTFTPKNVVNTYIVYEINLWVYTQGGNFTLGNSLFRAVKLTKNIDFDKYEYSGYRIGFHAWESFSLSDGRGFSKNEIIFVVDMNSSEHVK